MLPSSTTQNGDWIQDGGDNVLMTGNFQKG
jgi:hypothetical protein